MSVISITVAIDRPQHDGRRKLFYRIVDSIKGELVAYRGIVSASFDALADATAYSAKWQEYQRKVELNQIISRIEQGESALAIAQASGNRSTQKAIVRHILKEMLKRRDPYFVLAIEDLINYLNANYSMGQLASFLDVPVSKVNLVLTKAADIINSRSNLESADIVEDL